MGKNTRSSSPSALCVQNEPAKGGNGETRESSKENKSLRFSRFLSFSLSSSSSLSLLFFLSLALSLSCLCCYPFGASLTCLQQRGMVGSIAMLLLFLPCAIVSGRCVCDEGENMRKSTTITTNGTGRASTPALLVYCACGKRERARGDK